MAVHTYETLLQEDINVGVGTATKRNPGGGTLTGTQVGIHSLAVGQISISVTYDPTSVSPLGTLITTISYPGASLGDKVLASFSLDLGGLIIFSEVSATNTVRVTFFNPTTSAVDLASGTLNVIVLKTR